jgi:hypothetical protein
MKQEYIQKANKRQKQVIKVLVSKPSFIDVITVLRKKWKIPEQGIQSQTELDKWYQRLNEDTEQYFDKKWPSKRKGLIELRSKGSLAEYKKVQDDFNNNAPRNAFLIDIKRLAHEQKLSPRWVDGIKRYLLFNNPDNMGIFVGPVVNTSIDMEFDTETISIEIEANTTLEDIKAIWPSVIKAQTKLSYKKQKKFQPLRKFDRNKKAYELYKQGKKYREIADEFSKTGKTIGEEAIGKMIERYKKMVDINQA